jgi:hypothetical protein
MTLVNRMTLIMMIISRMTFLLIMLSRKAHCRIIIFEYITILARMKVELHSALWWHSAD